MKTYEYLTQFWFTLICILLIVAADESFYSIIAPGVIKSNRNYTVAITLHEASELAAIRVSIEGTHYQETHLAFVRPLETAQVTFSPPKLLQGEYKLLAKGVSGVRFRNESRILVNSVAGPKVYIQTDRILYKPGSLIQFRVLILDEHTRPFKIPEPIRVEILDGSRNRVKQFKDITLHKGVFNGQLRLSQYPVLGYWQIKVAVSGKYDYTASKIIRVNTYELPKFNVYIQTDKALVIGQDHALKALVYGKYLFEKYVEGNVTVKLLGLQKNPLIPDMKMPIQNQVMLNIPMDSIKDLNSLYGLELQVEIEELYTGLKQSHSASILIRNQSYNILVEHNSIELSKDNRYGVTVTVLHWNGTGVNDRTMPMVMQHGPKEYTAYLDDNGQAFFEFDNDGGNDFVFVFKNSSYTIPKYLWDRRPQHGRTDSYCRLRLIEDRPRLGVPLHIEVTSPEDIPYLAYTITGHGNIIQANTTIVPRYQKSHTLEIIPSIKMIPTSILYVHYIQNGNLRYEELQLNFPKQFENQISIQAPSHFEPGQEITIKLKAQPNSHVCLLAVDLEVYLFDRSYDLDKRQIMRQLADDSTNTPFATLEYPGRISGLLTFTNAHYDYIADPSIATRGSATSAMNSKVRFDFPETWIFQCLEISKNLTEITLNTTENDNHWLLTAFSVNEATGFGIVNRATEIVALKRFFITLNLPNSVKLGEIVAITLVVHNYFNETLDTEIILHNPAKDFYFMNSIIFDRERGMEDRGRIKRKTMAPHSHGRVTFLINPRKVGALKLNISARNSLISDTITRTLKVETEGLLKQLSKGLYVEVFSGETATASFKLDTPPDSFEDSKEITLLLGGDIMVPALHNIHKLILLPIGGGGEQNMLNFGANVLILQYLRIMEKLHEERDLVNRIKSSIEVAYQQQLSYRHADGGYSIFGPLQGEETSTWLTAYVIRYFMKASKLVHIETSIIASGLQYLSQAQQEDGSFLSNGSVLYPSQQNPYSFTAFVLMTFLEDRVSAIKYKTLITNGLKFLNSSLEHLENIHDLALVAMALQMARDINVENILNKLKSHSQQLSDRMWWTENDHNPPKDITITSYVLMASLGSANATDDDRRILKWLVGQRNENGGFLATHDTVVGLEALVKFMRKYYNFESRNLEIQYLAKANDGSIVKAGEFHVNGSNEIRWEAQGFPKNTSTIDIRATGYGHALLQLAYHYHVIPKDTHEHFRIQPEALMLNIRQMLLEICFCYQPTSLDGISTNMIIMEVHLPSGFITTDDSRNAVLTSGSIVRRIESINSDSGLIMYLENLSIRNKYCLNIIADKMYDVLVQKSSAIVVYDYYNTTRSDRVFYDHGIKSVGDGNINIR